MKTVAEIKQINTNLTSTAPIASVGHIPSRTRPLIEDIARGNFNTELSSVLPLCAQDYKLTDTQLAQLKAILRATAFAVIEGFGSENEWNEREFQRNMERAEVQRDRMKEEDRKRNLLASMRDLTPTNAVAYKGLKAKGQNELLEAFAKEYAAELTEHGTLKNPASVDYDDTSE